ncbi:MAG: hypothetical protein R2856_28395 [Caldilineaceae bacterium]
MEQVNPGTGTWAFAHAVYPGQLFAPDDPLLQDFCQLLDHLDDRQGIPRPRAGCPSRRCGATPPLFTPTSGSTPGGPTRRRITSTPLPATPRPRVWREEQSLAHIGLDQQIGDMPHNWASAEFIRLVRNLLVFERGDAGMLPGLPAEWIVPGRTLSITTPATQGTVHLSLAVGEDNTGALHVKIDGPPWRRRSASAFTVRARRVSVYAPHRPGRGHRSQAPSVRVVDVVDVLIGGEGAEIER